MNKIKRRRLSLERETVLVLAGKELASVAGGARMESEGYACTNRCPMTITEITCAYSCVDC